MVPVVCLSSLVFGNWPLKWDAKSGLFRIDRYFYLTSLTMLCNVIYFSNSLSIIQSQNNTTNINPQNLIIYTIYINVGVMVLNRLSNVENSRRFFNELHDGCGRTAESGRWLPEFWSRASFSVLLLYLLQYKYQRFTELSASEVAFELTVPAGLCEFAVTTIECQYTSVCRALADEFAAVNRKLAADTAGSASGGAVRPLSEAHSRLARLVRLFNDEYSVLILLTTVNLLLRQIYLLNDVVSMIIDGETYDPAYLNFICVYDAYQWTGCWLRFWWVCYRVEGLLGQVNLTAKIMLAKDINSFPEISRKSATNFLDQLLHRHIRITAWGFYDINNELLFMALGYQFGLCIICTQFTTSGNQIINDKTTVEKNRTTTVSAP